MPPKKKNNKKADDWEAELGETPESAAAAAPETKDEPAEADPEDEFPAGGLMAMMRKKQKKNKKGKPTEDFVEGEDPPTEDKPDHLAEKAPVEASIEDEFALPETKGKGKNALAKPAPAKENDDDDDDERGTDGKVLTKAQKEKLKKEREKQRKKENVSSV
jgi:translation initiation factor 5B